MVLSVEQQDRVKGVLLGAACGDALGVPYEFGPLLGVDDVPAMIGGGLGPYAPGEYSDDTQMAICIARVAATGLDLRTEEALDRVAIAFVSWLDGGASDVGAQTRAVLTASRGKPEAMRDAAKSVHDMTGRSAGNGSLMRTAPVALSFLDDQDAMVTAARAVSGLTHYDDLASDACVLWCSGIRHAVLDASFDGVHNGLSLLPADRASQWEKWLTEAEANPPSRFNPNGFVVPALQAAWSAVVHADDLPSALVAAVRAGDDTDTVAAIAGALAGARWGASAIPAQWRAAVHGWPGLRADDLVDLALRCVTEPRTRR